jgi:deoxyribonuclease-4
MPEPLDDLFGAHVSISGGVHNAPERAAAIQSRWTQIFTKAPQRWADPEFGEAQSESYRSACAEHGIVGTTVHASYLINAASPIQGLFEQSVRSLAGEYRRCAMIGAAHLVVHPGAATDGDREGGLRRHADAVVTVLKEVETETILCLEGTTGKGTVLGNTFEELAAMLSMISDRGGDWLDRVGICLDTCHLYASGYDITHGYETVMGQLEGTLGHERVRVWHMNDSRGGLGSTTDRHAWIGEGFIGEEGFANLVNDERFRGIPMLLETPKGDDAAASDIRNLTVLRGLRR